MNERKGDKEMTADNRITRLRCLAIIVVVFGHSIILYDPSWGVYSSIYTVSMLMWVKNIINTFQMPLFLFLSGFCFFYSVQKHQYISRQSIIIGIIGKMKRLLLPFVVIALFWMIPIRRNCKYTAWSDLNLIQICTRVFLGKDSGHLWFLPTLFLIFIFSFVVLPRKNKKTEDMLVLVVTFCGTVFASKIPAIFFLSNVASSLYWFVLGFECCKYKSISKDFINTRLKYGVLVSSIVAVLFIVRGEASGPFINVIEKIAVTFLIVSGYYCTSSEECSGLCRLISDESMGIYLFHSPLVYFTYAYYTDGMPVTVVFINFVVDGLIAMALTQLLRKSKVKWLIGY